jgi:hypothetical protein
VKLSKPAYPARGEADPALLKTPNHLAMGIRRDARQKDADRCLDQASSSARRAMRRSSTLPPFLDAYLDAQKPRVLRYSLAQSHTIFTGGMV